MELRNHTALITGGASGLGAATARTFHGAGANIMIMDLSADNGARMVSELGDRVAFAQGDVVDPDAMAQAVSETMTKFGALHILVTCAGIGPPAKVLGKEGPQSLDKFNLIIQVNLVGTFNAIRLAAEQMAKNDPNDQGERGVMITTASVAAFEGQIGQAAYTASKAGISGMTLPIAREFAATGMRVMTIAPGLFDTPLLATLPEDAKASLGKQVPFPSRLGHPEEFAALAEHIVVSPMLNGTTIRLDGAIRLAAR